MLSRSNQDRDIEAADAVVVCDPTNCKHDREWRAVVCSDSRAFRLFRGEADKNIVIVSSQPEF